MMTRDRRMNFVRVWLMGMMIMLATGACDRGARERDGVVKAPSAPSRYELGRLLAVEEVARVDIDVNPDGKGLPAGSGTAAQGAVVFAKHCAQCHGPRGEGISPNPKLMGRDPRNGFPFAQDLKHVHTIGNYWPYATTLYDYVRRAMPFS